ncbi:MAG TPA: M48 family metallopeptidase [Burkholderiales bacterium]|nr:M48 family metallopeptidase [Burkholderiales bacterium]
MNPEFLSQLFIIIVILISGLKLYLNFRQAKSIKNNINSIPEGFINYITLADHQKAANYNLEKLKLNNIENIVSSIVLLLFTLGGGIQLINNYLINLNQYPISQGVSVIICFSIINSIISLPFAVYSTFFIEQKYGFNNMNIKLFIVDIIKNTVLSSIIGIPLIYLILWLMEITNGYWWLWVWSVLVIFNLILLLIYPMFIAPIFNKFTPLDNEELKQKIEQLLIKCGFKTHGIFIMDGSKRSSHGNAYFTGIGRAKRIVFFDTLIKKLQFDEIEAILAHELGHFKNKHVLKQIIFSFTLTFVGLFILSLLIHQPLFFNTLGVTSITNYNGLILFILIMDIITFPFAPLSSYLSRKNEFEADDFAKNYSSKKDLINGLVKLYRDNASTLTPDSLYVKFYYSHPPASIRIAHLRE